MGGLVLVAIGRRGRIPLRPWNGRVYEAFVARLERRHACDLYHSALEVQLARTAS